MDRSLVFGGANEDGARGKWETIVKDSRAAILMMQTTKCVEGVRKKPHGFITYEHHRSGVGGGRLAICAKTDLSPVLVRIWQYHAPRLMAHRKMLK